MKTTAIKWINAARLKFERVFPRVIKFLQPVTIHRNPFAASEKEVEQARLMGMYLLQTNNKQSYAGNWTSSRERHRGRHAHVRERVSHFPR